MAVALGRSERVCTFWLEGRCKRHPCRFLHPPPPRPVPPDQKAQAQRSTARRPVPPSVPIKRPSLLVTQLVARLPAHHPGSSIRGLALPRSSTTLFTAGQDGFLKAWDCSTGLCNQQLFLDQPVSCLFNNFDDPNWLFVGLATEVRVINLAVKTQLSLSVGSPVLSLTSLGDLLLAGLEQGSILVWKFDAASTSFVAAASLLPAEDRHLSSVRTLEYFASSTASATTSKMLLSGHADGTLRVWDMGTGKCMDSVQAHHGAVTQILSCSPEWVLSASYADYKIALWKIHDGLQYTSSADNHLLELISTHVKRDAADQRLIRPIAMQGCFDENNTAMLFASYSNSAGVQVLELPSFTERGAILTEKPTRAMEIGAKNLLFLGSTNGCLTVWSWSKKLDNSLSSELLIQKPTVCRRDEVLQLL